MADDPRLEAVARAIAHADLGPQPDDRGPWANSAYRKEALKFLAAFDAAAAASGSAHQPISTPPPGQWV